MYGHVECASCYDLFTKGHYAVDHIEPVINIKDGFMGYDTMYKQLFCDASGLQVLCKPCHAKKTKGENAERRKHKKK